MDVRGARLGDLEGIQRIAQESWYRAYSEVLPQDAIERTYESWYADDRLMESIEGEGAAFLVAVDDADVVGYGSAGFPAKYPHPEIQRVYVDPTRWNEGVETALVRELVESVSDGHDQVLATVLEANEIGRDFYASYGFEPVEDRETTLGGKPVTELVLEASIDDVRSATGAQS